MLWLHKKKKKFFLLDDYSKAFFPLGFEIVLFSFGHTLFHGPNLSINKQLKAGF